MTIKSADHFVKQTFKEGEKWMREHGIDPNEQPPEDEEAQKKKITCACASVFVTLELPQEYYKMAAAIGQVFGYRNFDDYVSNLVVRDLETLRDGGEHLADWIEHIMPEKKEDDQ